MDESIIFYLTRSNEIFLFHFPTSYIFWRFIIVDSQNPMKWPGVFIDPKHAASPKGEPIQKIFLFHFPTSSIFGRFIIVDSQDPMKWMGVLIDLTFAASPVKDRRS